MNKLNKTILLLFIFTLLLAHGCRKTEEPPANGPDTNFSACISGGTSSSFEIVTLNLEGFPKGGYQTIVVVKDLINTINPDVIALQEIASESDFNALVRNLDGWEGRFYPIDNDLWNLAFLFKTSEVSIDDDKTSLILTGDNYAFPRPPFEIFVTHRSLNISTYLIDIHLKCCSGSDNEARRRDASEKLQAYIDSALPADPVIILGDFNDEIAGDSYNTNVFYNLVSDSSDYRFTDMAIAKGSLLWWSYPSYPSHIDHIMVTDELFSRIDTVKVLKPDPCYSSWFDLVTDHRPVELVMK